MDGTRPHSCCPRAGHYAPRLARHDLVAARQRLSQAGTALTSRHTHARLWRSRRCPASTTRWRGRSHAHPALSAIALPPQLHGAASVGLRNTAARPYPTTEQGFVCGGLRLDDLSVRERNWGANHMALLLGYAIMHVHLPTSSLPQAVRPSSWTPACVGTEDVEITRVWV
jgi:hypothetical protein